MWKPEPKTKNEDVQEAKNELVMLKAAKQLAKDNSLACMVEINGIKFGLCQNDKIKHRSPKIQRKFRHFRF